VFRLDVKSSRFEVFELCQIPRPNVDDVIPDSSNHGYFLVMGAEEVGGLTPEPGLVHGL
jgi:hypothetical protein